MLPASSPTRISSSRFLSDTACCYVASDNNICPALPRIFGVDRLALHVIGPAGYRWPRHRMPFNSAA